MSSLALPHTHIHPLMSDKALQLLKRFTKDQIFEFVYKWLESPYTRPPLTVEREYGPDEEEDDEEAKAVYMVQLVKEELKSEELQSMTKLGLLQKIRYDYWFDGFNLLQAAQIEMKHVIESKERHTWTFSTICHKDEEFVPNIDPDSFLQTLQKALYPLILGHMYVADREDLDMAVVRIQLFEPKAPSDLIEPGTTGSNTALKAIYVAFPYSTPYVVHTAGGANVSSVLYSLSLTLSKPGRPITLKQTDDLPVKSIAAFSILKGASRHASALGPWTIYADGIVDKSPLNPFVGQSPHRLKRKQSTLADEPGESDMSRQKRIKTNLLFTGLPDNPPERYRTRAQLPMAEIVLKEPWRTGKGSSFTPRVIMRLEGDDVFAGVYQLARSGVVDIDRMPSWLSGDTSATTLKISGGRAI